MNARFHVTALSFATITMLISCTQNPVTSDKPVETEPLNAQSLGNYTFASIATADVSAELLGMANPAPDSLLIPPSFSATIPSASSQLNKKALSGSINLDTINGILRITSSTAGTLAQRYDTIEVVLDQTVFDDVDGNESVKSLRGKTVYLSGTEEYYSVVDQDGDGIITKGGVSPKAQFTHTTLFKKAIDSHVAGEKNYAVFEIGAGTNGTFSANTDNTLQCVSWTKVVNNDTIAFARFADADGDGNIAQNSPGAVDISFFETKSIHKPSIDYSQASLRIERLTNGQERICKFTAEERLKSGRTNKVWITNEQGDSVLQSGTLALVHFTTTSPVATDSEATASIIYTIDPGKNIGDMSDNLCHKITCAKSYRYGPRSSAEFVCEFSPTVPHGALAEKGTFSLTIYYKNGTTASLGGTFSKGIIEGIYKVTGQQAEQVTLTGN